MNVLSKLFCFLFLFVSFYGLAQSQEVAKKPITATDIKGAWTCYETIRNYTKVDMTSYFYGLIDTEFVNYQWLITEDSIFEFEYPCANKNWHSFAVKSDSIFYDGYHIAFDRIDLKNDSLILTSPGGKRVPVRTKMFVRTKLDTAIVELLKREKINMNCYVGRMKIQRYTILENGKTEYLTFPVKMPEYIDIPNIEKAKKINETRTITLIIDGKKREFECSDAGWYKSRKNSKGKTTWQQKTLFQLYPSSEWWKGEKFEVLYRQE